MPREAWVLVKAVVSDTYPDNSLPGPQPPFPTPQPPLHPGWPTVPGWGGSLPGGQPPYPSQGPGFPTHPIAPGGPPLGMWGPNDPRPSPPIYIPITPPPDSGLSPEHPIYIPVYPDNSLPGSQPRPDNTLPGNQPYPDNTLPRPTSGTIAKIKAAVDFWTGNLPTDPSTKPEPV